MKKLICPRGLFMVSALLFSACGTGQATSVPTATSQAPTPRTTLPMAATASPAATAVAATPGENQGQKREIIVSATISLPDALKEIKAAFEAENSSVTVTYNLGASGDLQLQIEQGAPADVFLSAGQKQMDALESKSLLLEGTRKNIAGNFLVLVVPKDSPLGITGFTDLIKAEVKRVAIGNPATVPAGDYAQQTLQKLGFWDVLQGKLIQGENVRQVLTYVETGEVDAGLIYSSDAKTSAGVAVVAETFADSHTPVL